MLSYRVLKLPECILKIDESRLGLIRLNNVGIGLSVNITLVFKKFLLILGRHLGTFFKFIIYIHKYINIFLLT